MAEICYLCHEKVFWNERARALNKTWHINCFRCTDCSTRIALGQEYDHGGLPFCRTCYQKKYGARGFRGGGSSGLMVQGNYDGATPASLPSEIWASTRSSFKSSSSVKEEKPKKKETPPVRPVSRPDSRKSTGSKKETSQKRGNDVDMPPPKPVQRASVPKQETTRNRDEEVSKLTRYEEEDGRSDAGEDNKKQQEKGYIETTWEWVQSTDIYKDAANYLSKTLGPYFGSTK